MQFLRTSLVTLVLTFLASPALADRPTDGAMGFQEPATSIMERVYDFHTILLVIITAIVLFVSALLVWVMIKYNARANPTPKRFSHNTTVEIVWTVLPVLILLFISFFSFRELYYQDVFPDVADEEVVNVKAQGNQWNWTYSYLDVRDEEGYAFEFTSNPVHRGLSTDPVATEDAPRNLAVDYPLVVPVDTVIRVQTAASDVIHSFAMPSFGIKTDAIPGRLNQLWFRVNDEGVYFGQCSELCGKDHAFMPIEIRVVSRPEYDAWLERAQADLDDGRQYIAEISASDNRQFAEAR